MTYTKLVVRESGTRDFSINGKIFRTEWARSNNNNQEHWSWYIHVFCYMRTDSGSSWVPIHRWSDR